MLKSKVSIINGFRKKTSKLVWSVTGTIIHNLYRISFVSMTSYPEYFAHLLNSRSVNKSYNHENVKVLPGFVRFYVCLYLFLKYTGYSTDFKTWRKITGRLIPGLSSDFYKRQHHHQQIMGVDLGEDQGGINDDAQVGPK